MLLAGNIVQDGSLLVYLYLLFLVWVVSPELSRFRESAKRTGARGGAIVLIGGAFVAL